MAFEYKQHSRFEAAVDSSRCKASVSSPGRGIHIYQCRRKPWRDGWCQQHHPEEESARNKARNLRWEQGRIVEAEAQEKQAVNLLRTKGYTVFAPGEFDKLGRDLGLR